MSDQSRLYALDSDDECERLELQASLAGLERHLPTLELAPGENVLDVGCGSGSMSRTMARAQPAASVTGVDIRHKYIEYARQKAAEEELTNISFREADVFQLPFANDTFDVIWTKYLFQWLKDIRPAIAELGRVLRPGGRLISADFVDFAIEHHPVDDAFNADVRRIMPQFVDVGVGRKVAPSLLAHGFTDVAVNIETDTLFTVVGKIDPLRRRNWELQWKAARGRLIDIEGSEEKADHFIGQFLRYHDDPQVCSCTALYITRGVKESVTSGSACGDDK